MGSKLKLGDFTIDVEFKPIKNVHLSVYPPYGRVRIAAPERMKLDTVRVFAISRLAWIKQQQKKLLAQEREPTREYLDRESHYVWGKRYLLRVIEHDAAPAIELKHTRLVLKVRTGSNPDKRKEVLEEWYRLALKSAVEPLIDKWASRMEVKVGHCYVQRMKTKWGSCNHAARTIRLNTELAKKPLECLEYIVVHELTHLLEPTHNQRFIRLLDQFMPQWRHYKNELNRLPVSHDDWLY